jgi:hypothetical protein
MYSIASSLQKLTLEQVVPISFAAIVTASVFAGGSCAVEPSVVAGVVASAAFVEGQTEPAGPCKAGDEYRKECSRCKC